MTGTRGVSSEDYSRVAIVLHWLLALLVAAEAGLGFAMPPDASGFAAYQLHKSIGITILLLTLVRLGWRIGNRPPPRAEDGAGGHLAQAVHIAFYVVLVAMPLTGWAVISTAPVVVPTLLYGTLPWPHLPLAASLNEPAEAAHEALAYGGLGLFALHVAGALRHHFLLKDRLLARMSLTASPRPALLLGAAVIALGLTVFALTGSRESPDRATATAGPAQSAPAPKASGDPDRTAAEAADELAAELAEEAATDERAEAGPPEWSIVPGGSLGFEASNYGESVHGSFARWSGKITMDPDQPQTARLSIEVDLASASLKDPTQTETLLGDGFFAAALNPIATFRSNAVRRTGENAYRAEGTLTLKGRSHPQAIAFTLAGVGRTRSVRGSATIDRNAFGVGTGPEADGIAPEVRLDFRFVANRAGD